MKKDRKKTNAQPEAPDNEMAPETEAAPETPETPAAEETQREATAAEWQAALELAVSQRDENQKQLDEAKDRLLRTQADFQNFKRRNATARSDGYQEGICEAITAMLPAIDNLERALQAAPENDPLAEGVRMTLKSLMEGMKRFGFEEVPALGEDFDPEKHNAVMRAPGEEPGKVLEVFQKGYRVGDKIVRYAMVKVAVEE